MSHSRPMSFLFASLVAAACTTMQPSDTPDGGSSQGADASCEDLTGRWRLTAWTCDGTPTDLDGFGVELTMDFPTATSGSQTVKMFVPVGQTSTWYARTQGRTATGTSDTVTLTDAAPVESCTRSAGGLGDWGPVATGVGMESCRHDLGTPGTPSTAAMSCVASGSELELSVLSGDEDGPCGAGQLGVQTWTRQ